jgi:hypothetical protein
MITREQAIYAIYEIINSGIIDMELETRLQDIANCIDAENYGVHLWGTDEVKTYEHYIFGPSDFEEAEIMQNIKELDDDTEDGTEDNSDSVE